MENKVSVYVPCYNGEEYIGACLKSILNQSYPIDELIVINDGSADHSVDIISKFHVRLIDLKQNRGLANARNMAMQEAKNDFVVAVDADCIIEERWLEECMKYFDNPKVAAVGGRLVEERDCNIVDFWRRSHLKHHWGEERLTNPIFLSGSNVAIRKNVLQKIGFYDTRRYKNNYEDVDLSLRLRRKGYELIYEPKARAKHMRKDSIFSVLETFWRWKFHDYKQKYIMRPIFNLVNSVKLISDDIENREMRLIFIDILAFLFCNYFDLKEFFKKPHDKVTVCIDNYSQL